MFGVLASMFDGLLVGCVYGLAAMGLSLVWGVMNVINLAHGVMIAFGMFAVYFLFSGFGGNPYLLLLPTLIAGFICGVVIYWIAVHRVIGRPILTSLLSTFAVNMILVGLGTTLWSTSPYNLDFALPGITLGRYTFTGDHIAAAIAAVIMAAGLQIFLYYTRFGKAIRAVADNRDAAELMGISSAGVLTVSFGFGVALAAASGGLAATLFPFTVLSGGVYQLKSFVVTVLAGLGKPAGALVAGVLLGLLEGAVTPFIAISWIPLIEFGLFVVVLVLFPGGLFRRAGGC
jgi:branched-subunit amino acid ABC-type transport system permease component